MTLPDAYRFRGLGLIWPTDAAEFLSVHQYTHVQHWAEEIAKRPAVILGQRVNRTSGDEETRGPERHEANDLG
jgi:GST-like protein